MNRIIQTSSFQLIIKKNQPMCYSLVFQLFLFQFNLRSYSSFTRDDCYMYLSFTLFYFCNMSIVNVLIYEQKKKKDFFSKCDQIRWNWSHLLKKSLMENFFFVQCMINPFQPNPPFLYQSSLTVSGVIEMEQQSKMG